MLFERIGKSGRSVITTVAASAISLSVCCILAFAEDQDMNVLAQASSGPLRCEIRRSDTGGSVELTGFITSSRAVAGNFRFTIAKSGPSGASNINQGNKFDLSADKESRVGQVAINLEPDAHAVVELLAESDDGIQCVAKASLKP